MNCPESSILMQWLDGELSRKEAEEIKIHVESCSDCLSLVETQKRMESAWRESWTDPAPAAFEALRRNLSARSLPWWRRQRSWMAVAAVFAVYLGVKIFLIDGAGRPMAEVASENPPPAPRTEYFAEPEVIPWVPDESADAPPVEQEILEAQEEEVMPPAEEQQEEAEETDVPDLPQEIIEDVSVSESRSLSLGQSSGYGISGGIGEGGGGLAPEALPNEGLVVVDDAFQEEAMPMFSRDSAYGAAAAVPPDIQVSAELQGGETISLYREVWPELFQILDTILACETIPEGEPVVLFIDSTGLATGPLVPEGTVIALPDSTWGNSSITACSP